MTTTTTTPRTSPLARRCPRRADAQRSAAGNAHAESAGEDAWENHCHTPFGGLRGGELVDLNEAFARSEAFVHPRYRPEVDAGESWIVGRGCVAYWHTNTEHADYPPGYVPVGATPMEDFLSKLTVKVVVDAGTRQERTHLYRYADDPSIAVVMPTGPNPFGIPEHLPLASLIPRNAPLPVGTRDAAEPEQSAPRRGGGRPAEPRITSSRRRAANPQPQHTSNGHPRDVQREAAAGRARRPWLQ